MKKLFFAFIAIATILLTSCGKKTDTIAAAQIEKQRIADSSAANFTVTPDSFHMTKAVSATEDRLWDMNKDNGTVRGDVVKVTEETISSKVTVFTNGKSYTGYIYAKTKYAAGNYTDGDRSTILDRKAKYDRLLVCNAEEISVTVSNGTLAKITIPEKHITGSLYESMVIINLVQLCN